MPDPMSDERLKEIEARRVIVQPILPLAGPLSDFVEQGQEGMDMICKLVNFVLLHAQRDVPDLLAEVHRLRRALQLSEASRGVPSGVGRD